MRTRAQAEKETQAVKRIWVKDIVKEIRGEERKLQVYVQRYWDGENLGVEEREEFYHGRLRMKILEDKRSSFVKDNLCSEYVHYHGKAISARAVRD